MKAVIVAQTFIFRLVLKLMGMYFRFSKSFREEICSPENGYCFNKKIQLTTRNEDLNLFIIWENGSMKSGIGAVKNPDVTLVYKDKRTLASSFKNSGEENWDLILTGDLYYKGNMSLLQKFSYITTIFPAKSKKPDSPNFPPPSKITEEQSKVRKISNLVLGSRVDKVKYLKDTFLGEYASEDFPVLVDMKNRLFSEDTWVCAERAKNWTDFFQESNSSQDEKSPCLRQGLALKHIMSVKKPIIFENDLLPGTTTSKRLGVQMYPEMGSTALWAELNEFHSRELNPYRCSEEEKEWLNKQIFPYWLDKNIREVARSEFNNPLSQHLEELFAFYFSWKTQAVSHTIPNFETVLEKGFLRIIEEVKEKSAETKDKEKKNFYQGVAASIEGVLAYAENLKREAQNQVKILEADKTEKSLARIRELKKIIETLDRVPALPAVNFRDAISAIWIVWLTIHQESMNAGLSIGRLDQVLYPYFEYDMKAAKSEEEREKALKNIIELIGAFFLKCQDHLPCVPEIGNKLFGGSSSNQVITLGGVNADGTNAVNDLTYVFLKVTEMLCVKDPNMNARYYPSVNSLEYLKRLCEVNINTMSTPSIHNDKVMIEILENEGFKTEDARNWGATGCVEPTSIGKHFGHTNSMMFNLVAPLELLFNNGRHPMFGLKVGFETGEFSSENFPTLESLMEAYKKQLSYLIELSIEYNNNLGLTHQKEHPTPFISSLFEDALESGVDLINGGAAYNSSGTAMIALPDIVDSFAVMKKLVYENKVVSLQDLKALMEQDFKGEDGKAIFAKISGIPKFGSDDPVTSEIANDLIDFIYEQYHSRENYRGGRYLCGFWSMSYHTAFGKLSGTLPSGRLAGKSFSPGLTPSPGSSDQLLENIKTVAGLNSLKTPNNITFNVKITPKANEPHQDTVEHFSWYAKSYFDLGGLQMQFNAVTTEMLKEAMIHPEKYRWLMVRISGYNVYFTSLNRDMQIELIERTEFKV